MAENKYTAEYAKSGRSKCADSKCKTQIEKDTVRIGKVTKNPFNADSEDATMTKWYHFGCIFSALQRARGSTKKIESEADIEGFDDLKPEDQEAVKEAMKAGGKAAKKGGEKKKGTKRKKKASDDEGDDEEEEEEKPKKKKAKKPAAKKSQEVQEGL